MDDYNSNELDKTSFNEDAFEPHEDIEEIDTDPGERKANKHSLEMRRSIEDYFAKRRLKEMNDYLWDEEFVENPDKKE